MSDDATKTAAPRTKRVACPELQAMAELDRILCELPDASLPRVLGWLAAKHSNAITVLRGDPYTPKELDEGRR